MKMTRWCLLSTPFTHRDITTAIASKAKRMSIFCFHCRCKAVIICLGFFHLRVVIFNVQFAAVFKQSSLFDFPVTFFHCTAKLSSDISNNANKILWHLQQCQQSCDIFNNANNPLTSSTMPTILWHLQQCQQSHFSVAPASSLQTFKSHLPRCKWSDFFEPSKYFDFPVTYPTMHTRDLPVTSLMIHTTTLSSGLNFNNTNRCFKCRVQQCKL